MVIISKGRLSLGKIVVIYAVILAVWGIRVIGFNSATGAIVNPWVRETAEGIVKVIIWLGAGIFLLKKYGSELKTDAKAMVKTKPDGKLLISILGLFLIYHVISNIVTNHGFKINENFHAYEIIGTVVVAGTVEEIVFRGFLYNSLSRLFSFNKAAIISSVMFVIIHYPKYIWDGSFGFPWVLSVSIMIFLLGYTFAYVFEKSGSIWTSIILHMSWNLLVILM